MKRTLYEEKNADIWIKIVVHESDEGKIIVEGHDSGPRVKSIKGRDDYEYRLTIEKEEVSSWKNKLGLANTQELFTWLEKEYSTDKIISHLKKRLESLELKAQFSSW